MKLSGCDSRIRRKKSVKRAIIFSVIITLVLTMTGCNSLKDGVEKAKPFIPKGYSVEYIQQVSENSGIVFYTYEDQISAGIFIKNKLGWDWIGSSVGKLVTYPDGLQWRYADLGDKSKKQYSVYYGKVVNKDITKITVKTPNGKITEGRIVETDNLRMWFAFVDEPQVPSVNADITGYSDQNQVIYLFSQPKVN